MELKYLETFRAIVETGGFSKAAQALGYTQSTITFQVDQMERELSVRLFDRIGRRMVLTKAGERLVPYVVEALEAVGRLRCFESDLNAYKEELRVGAGETLLCYRLPPVLGEFHRQAPAARLLLKSMNCYDIRDELLKGNLDLGIFYEDVGGVRPGLAARSLGTYPVVLAASPRVKAEYSDFSTPDRHIPVPLIINEPACIFRQMFERYLQEKSIRLDPAIELWSIHTIKNLVKNDVGITFLPRFALEEELAKGELEEIPTDMENSSITAVCAWHENKWVSPAMELFAGLAAGVLHSI